MLGSSVPSVGLPSSVETGRIKPGGTALGVLGHLHQRAVEPGGPTEALLLRERVPCTPSGGYSARRR